MRLVKPGIFIPAHRVCRYYIYFCLNMLHILWLKREHQSPLKWQAYEFLGGRPN